MATDTPTAAFDFADQLALCSSEVLRFRLRRASKLTDPQRAQLEALETRLDEETAKLRAQGIVALRVLADPACVEVERASEDAEALLKRIAAFQRALGIATAVLGLAVAVVGADLGGVITAVQAIDAVVAP